MTPRYRALSIAHIWRALRLSVQAGVITLCFSSTALAEPVTFTAIGTGGAENVPVLGGDVSWVDSTGGISGSFLLALGFNPVMPAPSGAVWGVDYGETGSFLLSNSFSMADGQLLGLDFSVMTKHARPFEDVGFAILLEGLTVRAVLGNVRPDGTTHYGDFGNIPGTIYAPVTAGVTSTYTTGVLPGVASLGGVDYGLVGDLGDCRRACVTDVSSLYTPGAGTYRVLLGAFGESMDGKPMAVAVKSVTVPEPGTMVLWGVGLVGLGVARRFRRKADSLVDPR